MKTIVLLALLVALTTPAWALLAVGQNAWAANEAYLGIRPSTPDEWVAAHEICRRVESNPDICAMKNAYTETKALETAKIVLDACERNPVARCAETRAYIKQRWGY